MDEKRGEMLRHILAAKQLAGEINDAMVEYLLETALAEALTPEREEIAQALGKATAGSREMH